jgi:hypothetical protein
MWSAGDICFLLLILIELFFLSGLVSAVLPIVNVIL